MICEVNKVPDPNLKYDAVLMIGYGGPEKLDEVRPFIEGVLAGRPVPPERIDDVVHHYEAVGGRSPFNELTRGQADALAKRLAETGAPLPVHIGTRHWNPFLADTLRGMAERGERRAVGLIMAPHRCFSSWEQYRQDVATARQELGEDAPEVTYVKPWFDHPQFIEAAADHVAQHLASLRAAARTEAEVIFTAHSIPNRMAEAGPYVEELTETSRLVAARLNHKRWSIAYQSRSGRPEDPWLEPDICDLLTRRGEEGLRHAVVMPIGFVCDHVEVLYDLDIEAKQVAEKAGVTLLRASTVNDHPAFIAALAERVQAVLTR